MKGNIHNSIMSMEQPIKLKKREFGKYKIRISMSIDPEIYKKLEKARGKILRSTFIEDLIVDNC
jgi:hypothetical protein